MSRILCFDSWTRGSRHFVRLQNAFAQEGLQLKLVHLGSWGNDVGRPVVENIEQLDVADIAAYRGIDFDWILESEKPDAVVFLSTGTFAHRAMIRYCRARGIPTLNLYHGLLAVQAMGSYELAPKVYAGFVLRRLKKTFVKTLPCYVRSLRATRATPRDWLFFLKDVFDLATGRIINSGHYADDARTTHCCVYTKADISHAESLYGFSAEEVTVVGNPDLIHFGLQAKHIGRCLDPVRPLQPWIMYIDTALVSLGIAYSSWENFRQHIEATAESCRRLGYKLLLKPHPWHDIGRLKESFAGHNVELVAGDDFLAKLERCVACIVEPSSVTLVPMLLGLPVACARYGPLCNMQYGPVLTSYPRGQLLGALTDLPDFIRTQASVVSPSLFSKWANENSGPLPPEAMPNRVAGVVKNLLRAPR